jgi:hypothetical protein
MTIEIKPRWTDVGIELPDDSTTVLCFCQDELMFIGYLEAGTWYDDVKNEPIDVTHWMHLPEAP